MAEAQQFAEASLRQRKDAFRREAQSRREKVQQEENAKRKAVRETAALEIRALKSGAEKKEKEILQALVKKII